MKKTWNVMMIVNGRKSNGYDFTVLCRDRVSKYSVQRLLRLAQKYDVTKLEIDKSN